MNIIYVPIIVISSYLAGEIYKLLFGKKDKEHVWVPLIAVLTGGLLGVLIHFTAPELINALNPYEALLVGFVSGGSATGANELVKQIARKGRKDKNHGGES